MSRKSQTCFGRTSGKPLDHFDTQAEAEEGAAYARSRYGSHMVPYPCDRCGGWHLCPAERHTAGQRGSCTAHDGSTKVSYETREDAARRAALIFLERHVLLRVYDCACGAFHLTSR